jgi:hypothetical protein
MSYSYLLLGPVLLQAFELPPAISWGGAQALHIHKLPGGTRIIDAMGRDDAAITWTGIFTGSDCGLRARTIDLMRANGSIWPLTWDSFFYSVVIDRFEADYRRPNWIPYRISCTVLRDEAEALVEDVLALGTSLLADLGAADGFGSGINLAAAGAALAVSGATTTGTSANAAAQSQLTQTTTQTNTTLASTGQSLTATSDVTEATALAGQTAALANTRGYLQRAAANLSQAST